MKKECLKKEIKLLKLFPLGKIEECENQETFYLFNFLPLYKKSVNTKNRITYNVFGIRFLIRKQKFSQKQLVKLNSKYENLEPDVIYPKIKTAEETLNEIINTNKSIARFGDGEFNLIWGEDLPFQSFSKELQTRLHEILISDNENLIVGIPDIFTSLSAYNKNATNFWRKLIVTNREKIYNILNMDKQYFNSFVSRPYIDLENKSKCKNFFENFKKVWENKDVVFVEGNMSRLGFGNDLFNNCKSIKRILCPAKDAFSAYEEIFNACKELPKETLFIIALGPTATVLANDLATLGYKALDLGHIDIEYEWFLRKAKKKIAIKNKYVNEVRKGRINSDLNNEKYLSEIIKTIGN